MGLLLQQLLPSVALLLHAEQCHQVVQRYPFQSSHQQFPPHQEVRKHLCNYLEEPS